MTDMVQSYTDCLRTQPSAAAVNTCQQLEDNASRQTTARSSSLSESISGGIRTPGKSGQDDEDTPDEDTPDEDSGDDEYVFMTSMFGAMTIYPNGQNDT